MSQPELSDPPTRRRPPRFLFKLLNPLFTLILRSPLHPVLSKRLVLLTFTGRKSGNRYTTPIGYARVDGVLLSGTEGRWKANLRGGVPVRVLLRGQDIGGIAEIIDDEARMGQSYEAILARSPGYGRALAVRVASDGRPVQEDVARAKAEGHVVIQITLDGDDVSAPSPQSVSCRHRNPDSPPYDGRERY